ncbi:MAG: pyridoxal-phosphate dependent enzyme [Bergeyella zoohelcum]|nr:pyridoxal-phosphate dependent enzyme [Bergeyella zoohelcum]
MLTIPNIKIPIQEIPLGKKNIRLFIKREDLIHQEISGNKYWKLFHNVNQYLSQNKENQLLITFGGAYSNHILALSAFGKMAGIPTLGIIRGDELVDKWQDNPTLKEAFQNGMQFRFVTRIEYRDKVKITSELEEEFANALVIPEGGTNALAVEGVKNMLNTDTQIFDYLCTAVGTGGTIAGLSKFAEPHQKVLGFKVADDKSLENNVLCFSKNKNFTLFEASFGGYGKISEENIRFINAFYEANQLPLDPIYTGKMMQVLLQKIDENYFPNGSKILAFHTGGLQGIKGANEMLKKQNRELINFQ